MSIVRIALTTEDGEVLDQFAVEDIGRYEDVDLSHSIRDVLEAKFAILELNPRLTDEFIQTRRDDQCA
jgi:hypothetical protein